MIQINDLDQLAYLLLPVAAASGWLAARRHFLVKLAAQVELDAVRRAYRNSNSLNRPRADNLDDNHTDALNAPMALAALARKDGWVERAIALHQGLLARSGLKDEEREQLLFELGIDYLRAGLHDRAEDVFCGLLDYPRQRDAALVQLLDLYQQERDWRKALDCLQRLGGRGRHGETAAQFYCELAQDYRQQARLNEAFDCLKRAAEHDARCVRVSVLSAELALENGEFGNAYRQLQHVELQNPIYLTEIFPFILGYGEQLAERRELLAYLDHLAVKHRSIEAATAQAILLARYDSIDKAVDYLAAAVAIRPSLKGLNVLLGQLSELSTPPPYVFVVRQTLQRLLAQTPGYRCNQCGFGSERLHWRCPACRQWESQRPNSACDNGGALI